MSLTEIEPDLNTSVGQWAAQAPSILEVFDHLEIPYCCAGHVSLEEACWQRGLDAPAVLEQLRDLDRSLHEEGDARWSTAPLGDLCSHIERVHHAYLRNELEAVADLAARVARVHGSSHPELRLLQEALVPMSALLMLHLSKEEQVLFPMLRRQEQGGAIRPDVLRSAVRALEGEHDRIGEALDRIRALSDHYRVPPDGCLTYVILLQRLEHLEREMRHHIHKENNILFPRTRES